MRITVFIIAILQSCMILANSQDSLIESIFIEIYNQNYKPADSLLQENKAEINPFYYTVLKVDFSYWQNVTGTTNPNYKAFEHTLKQYKYQSAATLNQKAIQLIVLSYQLRYELKRLKIIDAIITRKKTKALFNELQKYRAQPPPEHQELFQLYSALFQYFDNYLKPFFIREKKDNCNNALTSMKQLLTRVRLKILTSEIQKCARFGLKILQE